MTYDADAGIENFRWNGGKQISEHVRHPLAGITIDVKPGLPWSLLTLLRPFWALQLPHFSVYTPPKGGREVVAQRM